ncbi:MAG: tRNA uridine(34) 5-carboxymethylaminomethyl modification radical SAM/GNAT enzyme Elp3 [Anaerolineae bacterium CG17_big_fil_post_rev_8_21_14_2_50_57_27]|nr:MAG: tRNA uridine(34) 5-carboxymethylaminomethyl modification radical SAM/GNAT enzyme Elp3 [Anaerolineae bacterium CG17_big_fil_post_rev_8_21_14_2_50_57_27]PJH76321.1 MAG: tRNA uridine(34) 5-carboxymethylaminomethyl modification radical SAM/GNAT enzyme Elp3 [Anaerolineae bacterium CG_4_9_14_0_8_um_filter_58_9]
MVKKSTFQQLRTLTPEKLALARLVLDEVRGGRPVAEAVRRHPVKGGYISKSVLVAAYNQLVESGAWQADPGLLARIRLKPVRTLSGVTTVTVLTKPYPCPGQCIFCPDEARMPKSYLSDEPGAMRAVEHNFDPYAQVKSRLETLEAVGHPTDKIELLILGGTWSAYRRDYQEWFVRRCFEAMNGPNPPSPPFPSREGGTGGLGLAHTLNETALHRDVGLAVETRPDEITPNELAWFRHLGVTKVQMGAQSLDDHILEINERGHTAAETHRAVALLRAAGFKIVLHWMPNLLGATLDSDRLDFPRLWDGLCPDEIKIYPTQLLENAPLYEYWRRGEYQPYTQEELLALIADIKPTIPRYCRVNRVVRDIPSTHVVAGNKRTSLRQDIHAELRRRGTRCNCIRCREVRGQTVETSALELNDLAYPADGAEEHFLSFVTLEDKIAGFLRLCLPNADSPSTGLSDLDGAAIIREVHIYGQSLPVGEEGNGAAQHTGLGTRLLEEAEKIARAHGFQRMAVIAAVGTRRYYLERGFERGKLYLVKSL